MVSIFTLSIGHGFGGIPAPGSFVTSAFPFPPKNSLEKYRRVFVPLPKCRPSPWEQTLSLSSAPITRAEKGDSTMYENRVELMGFLGKDPESKSTKQTGRKLAILSLATKTWWTGTDEQRHDKTEWHRIIVWNGLADYAADRLKKGDHLYVVG